MQFAKMFPQVLRWMARTIGGLILALILLHVAGEGVPNVEILAFSDGLLWAGFALSLVGFALLWKWELIGGLVALGGIVLFYAMNFAMSGKLPGGWVFPMFFLPGIFSIVCWMSTRCAPHNQSP